MSDVVLVTRRTIRADRARIFSAWTDPEQLVAWWGPRPVTCAGAVVDLRVGGRYRIDNRLPDGRIVVIEGEFHAIDPPRELVYTWRVGREPQSLVTVRFEPRGDATEVVVIHERIADEATRQSHDDGWRGCLDGLDRLFAQ